MSLNVKNRTIYCNDNLNILKGINNSCIDLIYLDPPFNSGREYTGTRKSMAELANFKDSWDEDDENIEWWFAIKEKHPRLYLYLKDVDDYANKSTQVYLTMMAVRLLEMHRILKDTGSLYYHCDQSAGHYIKIMLDIIFGMNNFNNEIIWAYSTSGRARRGHRNQWARKHDAIYWYTKNFKHSEADCTLECSPEYIASHYRQKDKNGRVCRIRIDAGKERLYYPDEGINGNDWWADIPYVNSQAKSRTGYPTQKPLALLERIIKASSNEGDIVLDPFCGCATTCVAAEKIGRHWIGIDVWEDACNIIEKRLNKDFDLWEGGTIHKLSRPPARTDTDPDTKSQRKREYIPDKVKEMVWQRDEGQCRNCGAKENLQYDHIIPHSKGGSNEITNLQILCRNCNLNKSNIYHS